jgi:hypothetical protein
MAKGTRGEEKKVEGPFRKLSVTLDNSKETGFQLVKTLRAFSQIRQSARTRAWAPPVRCAVGPTGLDSAQRYLLFFLFFFSRTLEIHRKL